MTPLISLLHYCHGSRGRTFGVAVAALTGLMLPGSNRLPWTSPTRVEKDWTGSTHVKHISRNKLRKKKPSQTVTANPEKLKGRVVREAGLD